MTNLNSTGSLGIKYAEGRSTNRSLRYRLNRRTQEVLSSITQFSQKPPKNIVDLGCADGRMLDSIHQHYPEAYCIGIEYSQELVDFSKEMFSGIEVVKGDVQSLELENDNFDVAIATAVIEHVPEPSKMIREVKRILKPGGIVILTCPAPFWEKLASMLGYLEKDKHYMVMNLKQLSNLVVQAGFTLVKDKKFMLPLIGMPFEAFIEKLLRLFPLDVFMVNQLLVARK